MDDVVWVFVGTLLIEDLFFLLQIYLLAEYVDFFAFGITALIAGDLIIKKINQG